MELSKSNQEIRFNLFDVVLQVYETESLPSGDAQPSYLTAMGTTVDHAASMVLEKRPLRGRNRKQEAADFMYKLVTINLICSGTSTKLLFVTLSTLKLNAKSVIVYKNVWTLPTFEAVQSGYANIPQRAGIASEADKVATAPYSKLVP